MGFGFKSATISITMGEKITCDECNGTLSEFKFCAFKILGKIKAIFLQDCSNKHIVIEKWETQYKEVILCCHTFLFYVKSHKPFLKQQYFHAFLSLNLYKIQFY